MKKNTGITITIIIFALLFSNYFYGKSSESNESTLPNTNKNSTSEVNSGPKMDKGKVSREGGEDNTLSLTQCMKLQESYYKALAPIYYKQYSLSLPLLAHSGDHHYQQLPFESLKSYAEAGDSEAMYIYGSELMWKGGLGVHMNSQWQTRELLSDGTRKLKISGPDINLFKQGRDYIYKAAVKGRVMGLYEIASMYKKSLKKLRQKGYKKSLIKQHIVKGYSYHLMAQKIMEKDRILGEDKYINAITIDDYIKLGLPESEIESVKKDLLAKAQINYSQLKSEWESDREYIGKKPYPKFFTKEEEKIYFKEMPEECEQKLTELSVEK
ncbi:hypothetical protein [Kangiella sediminilitoris]|uniref:Uncharacterized protein n=1 Tax=Kangiella sediminilitoris TaxID=1144748 RepID=A0A1B3BCM1_9GAMM|nr:hypothetical protein [Kangiella sediminilitoris]AOE50566.1 hypothetical protein KS2013_1857 [Kangiella sediminilitoris]